MNKMKKKNAEGSTIEKAKKKFRSVIGSEAVRFTCLLLVSWIMCIITGTPMIDVAKEVCNILL